VPAQDPVQRAARGATIAHAREEPQAFAREPVGRTLVAEQLAPAARPRTAPGVLAIRDGTGAGDDVDAIRARKRACPTAHHVVPATVAACGKRRSRRGIESRLQRSILAVCRHSEEGERQLRRRNTGLLQRAADAARQHCLECLETDLEMIGGALGVRAEHLPLFVDEKKERLASAPIDAEISLHGLPPYG